MDLVAVMLAFAGAMAMVTAMAVWLRPELCRRLAVVLLSRAHSVEVSREAMRQARMMRRTAMATAMREYSEDHATAAGYWSQSGSGAVSDGSYGRVVRHENGVTASTAGRESLFGVRGGGLATDPRCREYGEEHGGER